MITHTLLQNIMLVLFGAVIFVILLTTVHRTLQKTLFKGRAAILMALAISALCIVGMYQFLWVPADPSSGPNAENKTHVTLNYILLPYVALAVAILLSQLLLFASKILPGEKSEAVGKEKKSLAQKPKSVVAKPKSPGRPKKQAIGRKTVVSQSDRKEKN